MSGRAVHVRSMGGLGDCIYQRPLLHHLCTERDVWLSTPYPELYEDLPVRPVLWRGMRLRCQGKNMAAQPPGTWTVPPPRPERVEIVYALNMLERPIVAEMEARAGIRIADFRFDLPDAGPPPLSPPYAVVRPVSVRSEWRNTARNPRPEYVAEAAMILREMGHRVVVVGDLDETQEEGLLPIPEGDVTWTAGELDTRSLMALVRHASVVVGGVGWMVPATIAMGTPAVVIGGGLGGHNAPERLVDSRMDARRMRFLLPSPYCRCRDPRHDCPKTIPDFACSFRAALSEVMC